MADDRPPEDLADPQVPQRAWPARSAWSLLFAVLGYATGSRLEGSLLMLSRQMLAPVRGQQPV